MSKKVFVVQTGIANTASVLAGLRRAGAEPTLVHTAEEVEAADRLVLPGVGAFGPAMTTLHEHGLVEVLQTRIRALRPTLAICLGLQVLCKASDETPGVEGLGVIDTTVHRLPDTVRVPQLGWNKVEPSDGCRLLTPGYAYFANSYCITALPAPWQPAYTDHGGPFVAACEQGPVLACQFHPELSSAWGLGLLGRWLAR